MVDQPNLFDMVADEITEAMEGPGQARGSDPETSHTAAQLIRARASSARVVLLDAFSRYQEGLTDEEAAARAGVSLFSEYATRCSELTRAGVLEVVDGVTRPGRAGTDRMVRRITLLGWWVLSERKHRDA